MSIVNSNNMDFLVVIRYNNSIPYMEELRMTFGEVLHLLRKQEDLKQEDIARKIGVQKNTISNYENNVSKPHYEQLIKLCNLFNVDPNYLMQDDITIINTTKLNPEDQYIIDHYKSLTAHDREIVDHIFNMKLDKPSFIYKFPVYEQQAAAGAGITGRDGKFTMENIFTNDIPQNAVFGVHIKGTSMMNIDSDFNVEDIPDNSFVLLNPKVSVFDLNKTIVVASINNEVICKYFLIEQDGVHFYSLNRREHIGDDRFAKSPNEYRIIGQVVKIIKPNEHE